MALVCNNYLEVQLFEGLYHERDQGVGYDDELEETLAGFAVLAVAATTITTTTTITTADTAITTTTAIALTAATVAVLIFLSFWEPSCQSEGR